MSRLPQLMLSYGPMEQKYLNKLGQYVEK